MPELSILLITTTSAQSQAKAKAKAKTKPKTSQSHAKPKLLLVLQKRAISFDRIYLNILVVVDDVVEVTTVEERVGRQDGGQLRGLGGLYVVAPRRIRRGGAAPLRVLRRGVAPPRRSIRRGGAAPRKVVRRRGAAPRRAIRRGAVGELQLQALVLRPHTHKSGVKSKYPSSEQRRERSIRFP